jgi:hypothetical protein
MTDKERKLLEIAKKHIVTMEDRNNWDEAMRDDRDFFDVYITALYKAMADAYEAGKQEAANE